MASPRTAITAAQAISGRSRQFNRPAARTINRGNKIPGFPILKPGHIGMNATKSSISPTIRIWTQSCIRSHSRRFRLFPRRIHQRARSPQPAIDRTESGHRLAKRQRNQPLRQAAINSTFPLDRIVQKDFAANEMMLTAGLLTAALPTIHLSVCRSRVGTAPLFS